MSPANGWRETQAEEAATVARYDCAGLLWLLQGRVVVALTDATATIRTPSGGAVTYRKHRKPALGPLGDTLRRLRSVLMTTRPTPRLAEPLTIDQWWKNRAGQAVKISLSTFQDRNLIDVRTYSTVDGKLKPTVKGFAADIKHLPRLTAALGKACNRARELGLIDDDEATNE